MSRFIMFTLLLLVFFFGGMSYGSFEKDRLSHDAVKEEIIEEEIPVTVLETDTTPTIEEPDYLVHRTATFFEKIVTTVYEFIIQVLYEIANLFFD